MIKNRLCLYAVFVFAVCVSMLTSCTSYKNISYFKNITSDSGSVYAGGQNVPVAKYTPLIVAPDDILKVSVATLDGGVNGATNITSTDLATSALASGLPVTGSKAIDGYLVDKDGNIDIPVLGKITVAGSTIPGVQQKIIDKAAVYYKNPTVNVRLTNFKVTVLGEVTKPGTYVADGERLSVLDALGLAGDLTIYGKRENIMLIRQLGEAQKKIVRMDLNDTRMLASDYFYLKQGDVLYIEPTKGKAAATDMASTRTYAIAGSVLSLLIVLLTRINF